MPDALCPPKKGDAMSHVPAPLVVDVSSCSTVVACECDWRAVSTRRDEALLQYHEHRRRSHTAQPPTPSCGSCGRTGQVLPRKQLCPLCYRAVRAERARWIYHGGVMEAMV